jgi:excinuclease ABC subunit A
MAKKTDLTITKACENNLKGVSLSLPHDQLVGITGLSGSGKSSLAFNTVYAEGQRRYIETFSPYTRQFFDKVKRPKADHIENVRPAIAIQQRTRIVNSRSTVGSMTDIHDYLKIVWANLATPSCPTCQLPLSKWNAKTLTKLLRRWCTQKKDSVFLIGTRTSNTPQERERLLTLGYSRYVDPRSGSLVLFEDKAPAKKYKTIFVVIDRCKYGAFSEKQITDSLEQSFGIGNGTVSVIEQYEKRHTPLCRISVSGETSIPHKSLEEHFFSTSYRCGNNSLLIPPPKPSLFSYNHPSGACDACNGFGKTLVVDRSKCVPNHNKSIQDHAVDCWKGDAASGEHRQLLNFCEKHGISTTAPWSQISDEQRELLFHHKSREYVGILPWFTYLERKKYKMHVRVFISRYRTQVDCSACQGDRYKTTSLTYQIGGYSIADIARLPVGELSVWFNSILESLRGQAKLPRQLEDVCKSVQTRLYYLLKLGLSYLTLDRQSRTLSGGETQRVNLVAALGSNLISTHFVLDEPSVGLHARDTRALIESLRDLTKRGNSVTVVEHDPDCLEHADSIVELGPLAGERGGEIVYSGPRVQWQGLDVTTPIATKAAPETSARLELKDISARNLKKLSVTVPLQAFVCLTGVSGSGKSTLLTEVIQHGFDIHRGIVPGSPEDTGTVEGYEAVDQVLLVDQTPLAKSPRANIATYTKIWDRVRDLLAQTDDAKLRKLSRSAFSFNVSEGRCSTCEGAGFIREDMQFLSDVYIECEACLGKRFQAPVLEVTYKGKSVHDILCLSVDACHSFFSHEPKISKACELLSTLGLGHVTLGHPLSELSGGEAQRLKLVPHIAAGANNPCLFLFDEPTTGLHMKDVDRLAGLFHVLRQEGHSVICVEHNLRLIAASDWIIDLGPEGGSDGGRLVATGTPASFLETKNVKQSYTARFLKEYLSKKSTSTKESSDSASIQKQQNTQEIPSHITIRGAKEHNLKNISLSVPLQSLITITGVSGSGKSTIAKDIIYAEGQRRYLDCLSPYARQFIKELKKPVIDDISNIQPTICVYQHTFQPSNLSTVATMSEVNNFLRLLYAKIGLQFCPDHPDQSVSALSSEQIARYIKSNYQKPIRVLAPIIVQKKGPHKAVFERAIETEISEVRVDGTIEKASNHVDQGLEKNKVHSIEFVTSKFNPQNVPLDLIEEAISQALNLGSGTVILVDSNGDRVFSSERTCQICQRGFFKPDPEDLSFNSKRGRCTTCSGHGQIKNKTCKSCAGTRLQPIGRNIRLFNKNIAEASSLSAPELLDSLMILLENNDTKSVAEPVIRELRSKLQTLIDLGLEHVALSRECASLSNGELQRLRLATAMGSPLTGVTYIFDEPSAGLHPLDNKRLLSKLYALKESGNTVIQIEHEIDNIINSEHIIDVGPGAGTNGGTIVFEGPPSKALSCAQSVTGEALYKPITLNTTPPLSGEQILITSGRKNNLKNISCSIPLQSLVVIAGVSGSGKSSLVHGVLVDALQSSGAQDGTFVGEYGTAKPSLPIARTLVVDQQPIGKTSRSTPASYLGIWDEIRKLFAATLEAKSRGWTASFFSHNTGKGRCSACKGQGEQTLEMSFLAEAKVPCEECTSSRFTHEANSVRFKGISISDALKLTFEEAKTLFINHRKIHQICATACELGLGYLTLGQPSSTLSGGESQRLKLISELQLSRKAHTLYILDEPTTGLHRNDVALLLTALHKLTNQGHSVIVIEHDADTISSANWVMELGPEAGENGGTIIFEGLPTDLCNAKTPWGETLRERVQLHQSFGQAA